MARKKVKRKSTHTEHVIEKEFYEEIEVIDPNTGEKTIQKVKVTRYKPKTIKGSDATEGSDEVIDKINDSVNCPMMIDADA